MADVLEEKLLGAIARGWCAPENANKVMDTDLAFAISREVRKWLESELNWSGLFDLGAEAVVISYWVNDSAQA